MEIVAHIYTDFDSKFGIPRQSGLIEDLEGRIVFEPKYRNADAVKGLDGFDYIWLLWRFDCEMKSSVTVRPPRLGGNKRMGVFATRSPFRPNNIGLSSVRLKSIEYTEAGPVLYVCGADLRNNTAIYDIKPYLEYTDSHPGSKCGFSDSVFDNGLQVDFPEELKKILPQEKRNAAEKLLLQDPRPAYIASEPDRKYGMSFAGYDIKFYVDDGKLTVFAVEKL